MKIEEHVEVDVSALKPNPYQPEGRKNVDAETAEKFGKSILEHGLIQTPVGRLKNGFYEIGDGWLRKAGYEWLFSNGYPEYQKMPLIITDLTDQQMADMVMEANTIRKDLNPIDLAKFYQRYLEDFAIPQAELARRHNCSQGEIANTIRLLELPEEVQGKIISQEISETHGRQLLRLNYNLELQKNVLNEAVKDGYSVNQLSNHIAQTMYYQSHNLDPNDYPKPTFDIADCEKCPSRQKIGQPYSSNKKTWRCLDKECYQRKTEQAEEERTRQMAAKIEAVKKASGENKETAVLDLTKLTWRDYQELGTESHKIDNPEECETCPRRAPGKNWRDQTVMVCIDVKCFKSKEKAYQDKEAARAREQEKKLTERIKAACVSLKDESTAYELIVGYLLGHCRKDTRKKFGRMYDLKVDNIAHWFAVNIPTNEAEVITRTSALVLTLERYEGEKGVFQKMLADVEGSSSELNKALDAHRAKHCKGCVNDNDNRNCRHLLRRYGEGWNDKCYLKTLKKEEEDSEDEAALEESADARDRELDAAKEAELADAESNGDEQELLSFQFKYCDGCHWADQAKVGTGHPCCTFITTPHIIKGKCLTRKVEGELNLPCDDCANSPTCDRTYFHTDDTGKMVCEQKKPADPLAELVITTATKSGKEHLFKLREVEIRGKTLKDCTFGLGEQLGWGSSPEDIIQKLNELPATDNSGMLISILEGEDA